MGGMKRRLKRLEDAGEHAPETPREAEERRRHIREQAEHANRCRDRGEPPILKVAENGDVFCARDGRPVTDTRQTLAEQFYWQQVGWGNPGNLVHDEEAQTFRTPEGELALSRDRVNLRLFFRGLEP